MPASSDSASPHKLKKLIVNDIPGRREGTKPATNARPARRGIGEAGTATDAVLQFKRLQPDVALVDFTLPIRSGAQVITAIRREFPVARCLIITALSDDHCIRNSLQAGAAGYLHKDMLRRELLKAIRTIFAG